MGNTFDFMSSKDDIYYVGCTPYYKLIDVLKELHIKRFEYSDITGRDDDFITYHGVDYISPYMVMKLLEQADRESALSETQPLQYINPWATGN